MKIISKVVVFPLILLVRIYQWIISPLLPPVCRFQPTCSHYMIESLKIWGPLKGSYLGIRRIMRCHPWGGHGHDPVPPKTN
jgi:putative membrane protein insertion efficiency factor